MKIKYLFLFAGSLSLASCSNSEDGIVTLKNTAELNQVWMGEQTIKQVGNLAHSGERASVMDSVTEFGLGIEKSMNEVLKSSKIQKVDVKFWVYLRSPKLGANLVVNVSERNKPGSWHGYPIEKFVTEPNKWQLVTIEHVFSQEELENTENKFFSAYIWNASKSDFLVDDLEIEFHPEE